MEKKNFTLNLKFLREKSGKTKTELGELLGVGRHKYGRVETGESEADYELLLILRAYFELPIDYFFCEHVHLIQNYDLLKNSIKCPPNSPPNSPLIGEKTGILEEPESTYFTKNQAEIIEAQKHIIDSQKTLIDSLNQNISLLKQELKRN